MAGAEADVAGTDADGVTWAEADVAAGVEV